MMGGSVYITAHFSADWANQIIHNQPSLTLRQFHDVALNVRRRERYKTYAHLTGGEAVGSKLSSAIFKRWPKSLSMEYMV